jgi:hypothetical protein
MEFKSKILVATPSWNRKAIITLMAESLRLSELDLMNTEYLVSDDASTEYSEADLRVMFPWATIVKHATKHSNPLLNTHFCFTKFLEGNYSHLVILDSDMIVTPDWRARLEYLIKTPDFKIGSLYHSLFHPVTKDCGTYYIKDTAGFAGMVFTRDILQFARSSLGSSHDDWAVCRLVGKIFVVPKPSAVAHIGINGQWNGSQYSHIDKSADFLWDSVDSGLKAACETLLGVTL